MYSFIILEHFWSVYRMHYAIARGGNGAQMYLLDLLGEGVNRESI